LHYLGLLWLPRFIWVVVRIKINRNYIALRAIALCAIALFLRTAPDTEDAERRGERSPSDRISKFRKFSENNEVSLSKMDYYYFAFAQKSDLVLSAIALTHPIVA
jgi:hypothetical protein